MAGWARGLGLCVMSLLVYLSTAKHIESPEHSPQVPSEPGNPRDYRMVVVKGARMNKVKHNHQPVYEGVMEELASVLDEVNSEEALFEKTASADMLPDPNSDANRKLLRLLSSTEDMADERSQITSRLPKAIKKMLKRMKKERAQKKSRAKKSAPRAPGLNAGLEGQGKELSRSKRLVTSVDSKKWTGGIVPFVIDPSMDEDEEAIRDAYRAMAFYEKFSCVRFVPWVNGTQTTNEILGLDHPGFLRFLIPATGGEGEEDEEEEDEEEEDDDEKKEECWATFGNARHSTGQGIACCKKDVCVHELGHALGFDHENQNPLYGNWIRINKGSIDPVGLYNYDIRRADQTYSLGYDYTSIMHYVTRGWSIDGKETITSLFPEMETNIDVFYMFHELSDAYSCAATKCSNFTMTCANDGYVAFVNGECACMCPFQLDPATGCTTLLGHDDVACTDNNPSCPVWASNNECTTNPGWMNVNCKLSCNQCAAPACVDDNASCPYWQSIGECTANPGYMHVACKKSCGVCSVVAFPGGAYALPKTVDGCPDSGFQEGMLSHYGETTGGVCTDSHPTCPVWASQNECTANPGWMNVNCKFSCNQCSACDDLHVSCPGWASNGECESNPTYMLPTCRFSCNQCPPPANEVSTTFHLDGTVSDHLEERKFCVTSGQVGDASVKWPAGSYCIYKKGGSCQEGFSEGYAQYNDQHQGDEITSATGELPEGAFLNNTQLFYCCRDDGFPWDPIHLPNTDPFALFKLENECQEVVGMHVQSEYIMFNNLDGLIAETFGLTPVSEIDDFSYHFKTEYCYYTPSNNDCGGIYTLSAANPSVTITSPAGSYLDCSWLFTTGGKGRIVIKFSEFHLTSSEDACVDTLEIDSFRLGQSGLIYCGEDMRRSVSSQYDTLAMTYTTYENSVSNFTATVSIIQDATTCYNVADGGRSYGGTINYTRSFTPCLPWSDPGLLQCQHNTFDDLDRFDGLVENYCRNPGHGVRPWCYTNATDCRRDYCDSCQDENRYDTEDDCAAFKSAGSCTTDPQALSKCALTCQDELPAVEAPGDVSAVSCAPPVSPEHGVMTSTAKNTYSVGDVATFKCEFSPATVDIICLSTGAWSDVNTACVDCRDGWHYYKGSCYKYYYEFLLRNDAKSYCESQGALLASSLDADENAYLQSLKQSSLSVWLGLTDTAVEGTWQWDDGTPFGYSNWSPGEPNNYQGAEDCAVLSSNAKWNDIYCTSYKYTFICKHPQYASTGANNTCEDLNSLCSTWAERGFCESQYVEYMTVNCRCSCNLCFTDFYDHCADLVSADPDVCTTQADFMRRNCPVTCGISSC